jgi:hypothetical protein
MELVGLIGWLVGWLVGRSAGRSVGWSVGRLVGWSVIQLAYTRLSSFIVTLKM